ncbi:MAG: FG-GAP-like repeat-containing protein, partial [Cyclobacteriaceae bacterium]|nr:FG-GAP-like repeat-containing protein [Cyclobacteriaceae bacterium]
MIRKYILYILLTCSYAGFYGAFAQLPIPVQDYVLEFHGMGLKTDNQFPAMPESFTLEGWIYPQFTTEGVIFARRSDNEENLAFVVMQNGQSIEFRAHGVTNDTIAQITSGPVIEPNQWYHLAAVIDTDTLLLYINGIPIGKEIFKGTFKDGGYPLSIGSYLNNTTEFGVGFRGDLMQLRYWSTALGASEIVNYVTNGVNGSETGLSEVWTLNDGIDSVYTESLDGLNSLKYIAKDVFHFPTYVAKSIIDNLPYFELHTSHFTYPEEILDLRLIDLANDGFLDIVSPGWVPPPGFAPVSIGLNDGSGTFVSGTSTHVANPLEAMTQHARHLIAEDFNNDSLVDLFIADHGPDYGPENDGGQSRLMLQTSDGRIEDVTATHVPVVDSWAHYAASGDIENDGDIDILLGNIHEPGYELYINNGSGVFARNTSRMPDDRPDYTGYGVSSIMADVNKDGFVDIVSDGSWVGKERDIIFLNDGTGHFSYADSSAMPLRQPDTHSLAFEKGDFNADGWIDLVVSTTLYQHAGMTLLLNNQDGTFTDASNRLPGPKDFPWEGEWVYGFQVTDINADGWQDIIVNTSSGRSEIFINNGDAFFLSSRGILGQIIEHPDLGTNYLYPGDINNDGLVDIVVQLGSIVVSALQTKPFVTGTPPVELPGTPMMVKTLQDGKTLSAYWKNPGATLSVDIEISTTSDFSNIILKRYHITADTTYTFNMGQEGVYYWRIRAENTRGTSDWSLPSGQINIQNSPPSGVVLSDSIVYKYDLSHSGIIGILEAQDNDVADSHTFTLDNVNYPDSDNTYFSISGDTLRVVTLPYFLDSATFQVAVKVTDNENISHTSLLNIHIYDKKIILLMPFNGDKADYSSSGNHGTQNNSVYRQDRFGYDNSAIRLGDETECLFLNETLQLNDNFTIACWIKPEIIDEVGQHAIISETSNADVFQFKIYDASLAFSFSTADNFHTIQGNAVALNEWTHVAVVRRSDTLRLYQNGVMTLDTVVAGQIIKDLSTPEIGSNTNRSWAIFTGDLDNIRVYAEPLNHTDIKLMATKRNNEYFIQEALEICEGDSVYWSNDYYYTSGSYINDYEFKYSIDTIRELDLVIHPLPVIDLGQDTTIYKPLELSAGSGFDSYQWSNGESGQTILVDTTWGFGSHEIWVTVTDVNRCQNSDMIIVTTELFTSIRSAENGQVSVFPNPTNGMVFVDSEGPGGFLEIQVRSINGSLILKKSYRSQTKDLLNLMPF